MFQLSGFYYSMAPNLESIFVCFCRVRVLFWDPYQGTVFWKFPHIPVIHHLPYSAAHPNEEETGKGPNQGPIL